MLRKNSNLFLTCCKQKTNKYHNSETTLQSKSNYKPISGKSLIVLQYIYKSEDVTIFQDQFHVKFCVPNRKPLTLTSKDAVKSQKVQTKKLPDHNIAVAFYI
jgi:hypothetical protein